MIDKAVAVHKRDTIYVPYHPKCTHERQRKPWKNSKIGVFDYYNMQNIQADTSMRTSISDEDNVDKDQNINQDKK